MKKVRIECDIGVCDYIYIFVVKINLRARPKRLCNTYIFYLVKRNLELVKKILYFIWITSSVAKITYIYIFGTIDLI